MVMNYVLTPFSYIHAEDLFSDIDEVVEDVVIEEVVEENVEEDSDIEENEVDDVDEEESGDEDENTDESDEEKTTEDVNNEGWSDAEVNTWDTTEINTWDTTEINTWDTTEINTWDTTEINTWDTTEINTWDTTEINTWDTTEINTWDTTEINTWDTTEINTWDTTEINTWDNQWWNWGGNWWSSVIEPDENEKLENIWDELNEEELEWSTDNNGIIFKVKAPVNSFPKWTELNVSVLDDEEEINELKELIINQYNNVLVENDFTIFDVSFLYVLSDWEEVELQAYTWQTVKVSFDYSNNDKLVELSNIEWNELKVYYIDDNEEVQEAVLDEEQTIDWEMVIDGEYMNKYLIVAQVKPILPIDVLKESVEEVKEKMEQLRAERLANMWNELNEEEIVWEDMYKDVIVNVVAPVNSFPKWTELRISPITTKKDIQAIKDQLVENTDVTEDSEVVSFDISFIYTILSWEEIELQPYTWQTVKVSFNYTYNDNLSEVDSDNSKELKVYHLEEVKDEMGNKTSEVEVKEVELNNIESSEWELVVDADTFSVYSVAAVDAPVLRAVTAVNYTPESCFTKEITPDGLWLNITNYTVNANNWCTTDVIIPPYMTVNGVEYPVIWLSYYTDYNPSQTQYNHSGAFYNKWLTSVVLPETLQIIWRYSFRQNNLTSVVIPESVLQIDPGAFNINNFPCNEWIIYGRLNGEIDYTKIVSFWWQNCAVIIPEWVKTITDRAFYNSSITSLTLPSTIESIGALAFYTNSISSVTIPAWVNTLYVGQTAFRKTSNSSTSVTCNKQNSSTQVLPMLYTGSNNSYGTYLNCVSEPSNYTVVFDSNWWSAVANQSFSNNSSTVIIPTPPTRTWYRFDHWYYYNSSNNQTMFTTQNTFSSLFWSSVRVWYMYATWNVNTYTIEFSGWVDSEWETPSISAIYDRLYSAPDNGFSKQWYAFNGWNTDINWNGTTYRPWDGLINLTWAHQATVTLYAQWEKANTVTFNSNGWSSVDPQYVVSWSTAIQPNNPTLSMHSFEGWYSDPELTMLFDFSTPITHNITLYAKWEERNSLLVTFNSNGGTNIPSQEVWYWEKVIKPSDPTKNSQIFMYWTTDSAWNNEYDFNSVVTEDLELYAKWWNICTVSFGNGRCYRNTSNESTCEFDLPSPIQVACWMPITRPDDPDSFSAWSWFRSYTYYFSRWSQVNNAQYNNTSNDWNFDNPVTKNITLYAMWNSTTYRVTFNANGWVLVGGDSQEVDTMWREAIANKPEDPTRLWYNFKWWSTTQNNWSEYNFNTHITSNTTLYAQWTPITYYIRYNSNWGIWSMGDSEMTYGATSYLSVNSFTKANAQFSGWNTKIDWSGTWYTNRQSVSNLWTIQWEIVNLYAQWKCNTNFHDDWEWNCVPYTRTVTVNVNEEWYGTVTNNSIVADYGTEISTSSNVLTIWDTMITATPSASTNQYTYSFSWWNNTCWNTLTTNCTITAQFNRDLNTYTIDFVNRDWTVLQSSNFGYWTTPIYNWSTPTSGSTVEYNYTFKGWDKEVVAVTESTTYTATYTSNKRSYTISWLNEDWTLMDTTTVEYWVVPTHSDPTQPADDHYTYTFKGWDPTPLAVTWTASYRATFNYIPREYTITFVDEDWTELQSSDIEYWETPVYNGTTPSKEADAQYTYSFNWWNPSIHSVTWAQVYTATYSSTVNQYNVTFIDWDGTVLKAATAYDYWTPSANIAKPANPTRADTAQTGYSFNGWNPSVADVTADATYRATYTETVNKYTVTWNNSDGTPLEVDENVPYGTNPSYDWETPTSGWNAQYSYTFAGWTPAVSNVVWDVTYTANYNTITNSYIIKFVNYNGVELQSETLEYGETPVYKWATPTKPDTDEFTYSFNGWNPTITSVVGAQVYTATYSSTVNKYTITWKDGNNNTLKTDEVAYWTTPSYSGETPTKARTQQYSYVWDNTWTPEPAAVTWNFTYTANFDEVLNQYTATITVSPADYGKVNNLDSTTVTDYYGSTISINNNVLTISWTNVTATPIDWRPEYTYIFTGWTNNCGNELTGDCEIIANFDRAKIEYTATFNSNWGSAVASQTKPYWSTFNRPADPTKDGYDFVDWYADSGLNLVYNFNDSVIQDIALYAKWTPHVYTINYTLNWGTVSPANPTSYTIESWNFTLNNPTRTWYEFKWWTWTKLSGLTSTVTIAQWSTGDRTYVANWEAVDVDVTINHYTQDLTAATNQLPGTYTKISTTTSVAKADSMVQVANYKLINIDGFTYNEWKVDWETVVQTRVLPDWSLVIDLYYTRNSKTFTLITDLGSVTNWTSPSGSYYYGAIITLSGSTTDCYMWNQWKVTGATLANNQQQTTFTMPNNNVTAESLVTEKTYNIAFDGNWHTSGTTPTMNGVRCTATVALTGNGFAKTWYTFTGWSLTAWGAKAYSDQWSVTTLTTGNNETVTLYAIWDANKHTPYTVNHWYLNVNGERTTSDKTTEDLSWTTAASVTPAVIWRNGFISPATQTVTIAADGSTVVDYDYTRKSYTLTFVTTGTQPQPVSRDVIYGWALNVTETSAISGYTFLGWSPDPTNMTMPADNLELIATWSANTTTPYKIEHYRQNLENDNYTKHETEDKTGTTDTTATASSKTYEGFTYNPSDPRNEISGNVDGHGTLVLKLYYTRNVHTITFVTSGGTNIPAITAKYGSWITAPADPTKDGYDFAGWDNSIPATMPDEKIIQVKLDIHS